jgi:hypothetical protein
MQRPEVRSNFRILRTVSGYPTAGRSSSASVRCSADIKLVRSLQLGQVCQLLNRPEPHNQTGE